MIDICRHCGKDILLLTTHWGVLHWKHEASQMFNCDIAVIKAGQHAAPAELAAVVRDEHR